jgi:hypothetical protein
MKFQKQLSSVEQTFHYAPLAETCIPYKQWKKTIKYGSHSWSLKDLEHQCQMVEQVFHQTAAAKAKASASEKSGWGWGCCHRRRVVPAARAVPEEELLTFAEINAVAVYKVCKKLEKTKRVVGAMKFLERLRTSHKYSFMGSAQTTFLHFNDPLDPIDRTCPICFEDLGEARVAMILPCGHYHCFECFGQMTPYHHITATFYNRLRIIQFQCPICRQSCPEDFVHSLAFWPKLPEDAKHNGVLLRKNVNKNVYNV